MHKFEVAIPALIAMSVMAMPSVSMAWSEQGHMMIAHIAWQQLTPSQRTKLIEVLKGNPELFKMLEDALPPDTATADRDMHLFMVASLWPDMIKKADSTMHAESRSTWHYINLPIAVEGKNPTAPSMDWKASAEPSNVVQALARCTHDLRDKDLSKSERAIRLCWVLHLVGDLHQPLHSVAFFSKRYGKGDAGGNNITVKDGNKAPENLHKYWDEMPGGSNKPATAALTATALLTKPELAPTKLADVVKKLDPAGWAEESRILAETWVYEGKKFPPPNTEATKETPLPLPDGYGVRARPVVDKQLVVGGLRLAGTLAYRP